MWWRIVLLVVTLPWTLDAAFRAVLALMALRQPVPEGSGEPTTDESVLVVVPARDEGGRVLPTLTSVLEAARPGVETVLLLDGPDPEAEAAARRLGVRILCKDPAGPTKGAALRWLVDRHGGLLEGFDAVLILDVGSSLGPGFFHAPLLPGGADAAQAWLAGRGTGVGDAVLLSERAAQRWEDLGRQALGWSVRLRGTGSAYRPGTLAALAPELVTAIEDTEASLLLAARCGRVVLTAPGQVVEDVKPSTVGEAARQRSRWLLGQLELPFRHPGALLRLVLHRPLEGLAFAAELASRPLSLTAPLRLGAGVALTAAGILQRQPGWVLYGTTVAASLVVDAVVLRKTSGLPWGRLLRSSVGLALSWLGAVLRLPRAATGWVRTRRR